MMLYILHGIEYSVMEHGDEDAACNNKQKGEAFVWGHRAFLEQGSSASCADTIVNIEEYEQEGYR